MTYPKDSHSQEFTLEMNSVKVSLVTVFEQHLFQEFASNGVDACCFVINEFPTLTCGAYAVVPAGGFIYLFYNLTEDGNFMARKLFASPCFVWLFVRVCVFVMFPERLLDSVFRGPLQSEGIS